MRVNFKRITFVVGIFVIVGLTFFAPQYFMAEAMGADDVAIRLSWKASAEHTPFIMAMDKGFYKEEGINIISLKEGTGGMAVMKIIAAGQETFANTGTNTAVNGISEGQPILPIMNLVPSMQIGIISRAEAAISEPKDLIGKTIAGGGGSAADMFEAFLSMHKIPREKVNYLSAGTGYLQAFVSGKADCVLDVTLNGVPIVKKMGVKSPVALLYSDWGLPEVGSVVITHLDTVKKNPDMIRRFVKATLRGINYTFMDIDKTVDIVLKHFPMTDRELLTTGLTRIKWCYSPPIGWSDPKNFEGLREIAANFSGIAGAKNIPLNRLFTNEFLPKF